MLFSHFIISNSFVTPWTLAHQTLSMGLDSHSLLQGISRPMDQTCVSRITGRFFTIEPLGKFKGKLCCHSVTQSLRLFVTLWNAAHQGFPVLHHLLEFAQTHGNWVGNTTQLSHPLLSPSPALNLSQHQGLFQWVSSLHKVAKVLELQLQH